MNKSLNLLALIIVSATSISISEVQAGGGAGWGIAGGLIGASVIASAASRDRGDRVYVTNNYPASPEVVYDANGQPMIYNGQQYVYLQDNSQNRRGNRRKMRREERAIERDLREVDEAEEAYE